MDKAKESGKKMTGIAMTAIILALIFAIITAASVTKGVPPGETATFYLIPKDSSAPAYCNNTTVEVWLNTTISTFGMDFTLTTNNASCGNIIIGSYEHNTTVFSQHAVHIDDGTTFKMESWRPAYDEQPPGVYHVGNLSIHCNSTEYCVANLNFTPNVPWTYITNTSGDTNTAVDNGTFACTEAIHDINITTDYTGAVNGIKITHGADVVGPDENLTIGETYKIRYKLVNEGDSDESVNVKVSVANETWYYTIGTHTYSLDSGKSKIYSDTWDTSGLALGNYNITVNASIPVDDDWSNNERNREVTLESPFAPEPDLTPTAITPPAHIYANVSNTINATIKNIGGEDAGPFNVSLTAIGTWVDKAKVDLLSAGASEEVSFEWTPTSADGYELCVVADSDAEVEESDETNNELCESVTVEEQPEPDLTPTAITKPAHIVANMSNTIKATIENAGSADATAFNVSVTANGTVVDEESVDSLSAGTSKEVSFEWTPASAGDYELCVVADTYAEVEESDEENNELCVDVVVEEKREVPPDVEERCTEQGGTIVAWDSCNNGIGYSIPGPAGGDPHCIQVDCCGWYQTAHVHDLGSIISTSDLILEYTPGYVHGCTDTVTIQTSPDDVCWTTVACFSTVSNNTCPGMPYECWETYTKKIHNVANFRYVKISIPNCFNDYSAAYACKVAPPCLRVDIGNYTIPPGSSVQVPITIYNMDDYGTGTICVEYNPLVAHVTSVGSSPDSKVVSSNIDNSLGTAFISAWNTTGVSGDIIFAYVTLKAVGPQGISTSLNLNVSDLEDTWYNDIPACPVPGSLAIREGDPPVVGNPIATPSTILNDNGRARVPGTNVSQLSVSVADTSGVSSVTINLTPILGPSHDSVPMNLIEGTVYDGIWSVTTNADYEPGVDKTHCLAVNATDVSGNSNTGKCILLTVLRRGDVVRDNSVDIVDAYHIARYTVGLVPAPDEFVAGVVPADSYDGVDMSDALYIARYTVGLEPAP